MTYKDFSGANQPWTKRLRDWFDYEFLGLFRYWWWSVIKDFPRQIRNRLQRSRRGWADDDLWDMDMHLGRIIFEMTEALSKHHCGYPTALKNEKAWKKILKEISDGFKANYYLIRDINVTRTHCKKTQQKLQKSFRLFAKYFNHLWD